MLRHGILDPAWARAFAEEWVSAWNSHDIERILSHYREDFEMRSPLICERMGEPSGMLRGKEQVRRYWEIGLASSPPLHFELIDILVGVNSLVILYRSVGRRFVAEVLTFNEQGEVTQGSAHYGQPDAPVPNVLL